MEKEVEMITKTRRARIAEEKKQVMKARQRKLVGYAFAGTIAASALLVNGSEKGTASADSYTVQRGDTLYSLAKKYGVSVEKIQETNNLANDVIKVGQTLEVPPSSGETMRYTIVRGDTLFSLAKTYGTSVDSLKSMNGLQSDQIYAGQVINVPAMSTTSGGELKTADLQVSSAPVAVERAVYTVAPGDTLWSIARRFDTTVAKLKKDNALQSDVILIGQKLAIVNDGLYKADATVVGAADNFSVEFIINGEHEVLQVAYGTGEDFEKIAKKKVEMYYKANGKRPALIAYRQAPSE
ncbi:D-gamma-glutamyl-meso-diaminopimelic acid endopeptidase CwlS [Evansella caseinilytica]|uniref:D-gamma-glutamyl-meso-diaminopimelic acid endopeptidase CwlS n=1 Tax=Evansella caseinilytica TaxID=1503961 RepID=A0A1H3RFE5_9BACI|nr:LysM peptidoglycan-binding domain-containing protein [Evansella caseinilytica]SDZ24444.1 D-gamma-glutamyl-meso-diaminopimelic acid endopeptidase CwlS [Evansella caseinilytica]